jgi:hypothetical protein
VAEKTVGQSDFLRTLLQLLNVMDFLKFDIFSAQINVIKNKNIFTE